MKPLRRLLLTGAITAGILVLAALLRTQYPRLLARYWRGQLDTVPDEQARELLGKIGELGEPGIPVLVQGLGSRRESVARAAKQVLLERLDLWTTLPADEVSPKLLILADALARQVDHFGPTARRDAEDLATWLLRWHPQAEEADRARLIALCRKVLEATSLDQSELAQDSAGDWPEDAGRGRPGETAGAGLPQSMPSDQSPKPENAIADLARLPGGGLPIETFPPGVLPPGLSAGSDIAGVEGVEPQPLRDSAATRIPAILGGRSPLRPDPNDPASGPEALRGSETSTAGADPQASGAGRAGQRPSGGAEDLTPVDTLDLMRRLRTSGGDAMARVRAELARRGFNEVHLELARRLFDPDPEVRLELARRLPGLESVDAAPWLLWLSEDKDPEVRLAAITLLATTDDPALLRQVRTIAARDPDPRIRRQAERLAQRADGPASR